MKTQPLPLDRIGQRFSVRLHDPEGGYRDVVGHLKSANSVINRSGDEISFDPEQIFIWREILERPKMAGKGAPLTLRVFELDRICNATWPATTNLEVDGWLMRVAGGVTNRANSVLPLPNSLAATGEDEFAMKITQARNYYAGHGQPVIFQLALPTWVELHERLLSIGAIETIRGNTMVADLKPQQIDLPTGFELRQSSELPEPWLAINPTVDIEKILTGCSATYLSISKAGQVVATARIALAENWSSITRVYVIKEFRGQGLAKLIVASALQASLAQGATKAVLQVDALNAIAIAVYEALGFNFHHEYCYLELESAC